MVVAALMGLHYLPSIHVGDHELRGVDLLADVRGGDGVEQTAAAGSTDSPTDPAADGGDKVTDDSTAMMAYRGLDHFCSVLDSVRLRPVRIAYFGDSFIEGDIMTSALRELLQTEYGGRGVGWVDIQSALAGFRTTVNEMSRGWVEHVAVGAGSKGFDADLQGVSGRYYVPTAGAYIDIRGERRVYAEHLDTALRATLFFTPSPGLKLRCGVNGEQAETVYEAVDDTTATDTIEALTLRGKIGRIRIDVEGEGRFYGLALDSWRGITLDCFPMRGSPGYHIGTVPEQTLRRFAKLRPYDLIIFHFGLNMASPTVKTYVPWATRFKQCIELYKRVYPQASFLLVSMNDRDVRGADGQMHTMDGVVRFIETQQQIAAEEGIAFWNLREAMGGEGSMERLQKEGKANHDYTHINFRGGEELGQLLYDYLKEQCTKH